MEDAVDRLLDRIRAGGTIDASGVRFAPEQLARMLEAAPGDPERPGRSLLENAKFDGAFFEGAASFNGVTFRGPTSFVGVTFQRAAEFVGLTFQDAVSFFNASFQRGAWFHKVVFGGEAVFRDAIVNGDASFLAVTFKSDARFDGAIVVGKASFFGTTFDGARDLGPVAVHRVLDLEQTVFAQPIRIEASALALSCARAQFRGGADLLVRWAEVALDDADFAEPSLLAPRHEPLREEEALELQEGHDWERKAAPRVISVRRAKLANLTIAGADMRACRFEGAHGLDSCVWSGSALRGRPPAGREPSGGDCQAGGRAARRSPKSTNGVGR